MSRTACVIVLFILVAGCGRNDAPIDAPLVPGGKSAAKVKPPGEYQEGVTWTRKELLRYLASKGVQVKVEDNPDPDADTSRGVVCNLHQGDDVVTLHFKYSTREVNELATLNGDDAYPWGRFCFVKTPFGTDRLFERIRKTLAAHTDPSSRPSSVVEIGVDPLDRHSGYAPPSPAPKK